MRVYARKGKNLDFSTDLLVIPVTEHQLKQSSKKDSATRTVTIAKVNQYFDNLPLRELKREAFKAKAQTHSLLRTPGDKMCKAILFVGWPKKEKKDENSFEAVMHYRKLGALISKTAASLRLKRITVLEEPCIFNEKENLIALIEGLNLSSYRFEKYKKVDDKAPSITELALQTNKSIAKGVAKEAEVLCQATMLARDLVNMPAADCTPSYLVRTARSLAKKGGLRVQIFDRNRLKKIKAFSLLSVSEGSSENPYLIKLTYKPKKRTTKVISLVGKGITFDSGGYSIKPSSGMMDMKCDMSGAATVLATMKAIAELKPSVEVRAYVPTCENMINGKATRPGDVVKAMNGKTIEILNTDAEGRLILADALVMAEKDGCDTILDFATLTGACMVALGDSYAGVFTKEEKLSEQLVKKGALAGERLWPMPLAEEYREQLKSSIADIKNIGGRFGGAITAGLFLSEFVKDTPWAHIDIAGPAFTEAPKGHITKGGVGFGVRTTTKYLLSL